MAKKSQEKGDWRDNLLTDLPEGPVTFRANTYPTALEIIKAIEEGDSYTPRIMTVGGSIQFGDTVRDINQAAQH